MINYKLLKLLKVSHLIEVAEIESLRVEKEQIKYEHYKSLEILVGVLISNIYVV